MGYAHAARCGAQFTIGDAKNVFTHGGKKVISGNDSNKKYLQILTEYLDTDT